MPRYDFLNKDTGEVEIHTMSYTKLDEFKESNPHLERYFAAEDLPVMSDGSRLSTPGIGKPDSSFEKYVIQFLVTQCPDTKRKRLENGKSTNSRTSWWWPLQTTSISTTNQEETSTKSACTA